MYLSQSVISYGTAIWGGTYNTQNVKGGNAYINIHLIYVKS